MVNNIFITILSLFLRIPKKFWPVFVYSLLCNFYQKYIGQLVAKFQKTASVAYKKKQKLLGDATQIEVITTGLSRESLIKVLKLCNFHPYKMQILQELGMMI